MLLKNVRSLKVYGSFEKFVPWFQSPFALDAQHAVHITVDRNLDHRKTTDLAAEIKRAS